MRRWELAHPADLRDELEAWGEVFADYETLQPFPQLGRPLHRAAGRGPPAAALNPGIAVGAVDVFPEVKFTELWFSAEGRGYRSARTTSPNTLEIDPITACELLSELEGLWS